MGSQNKYIFLSTVYIWQIIVEMNFLRTTDALKVVLLWHSLDTARILGRESMRVSVREQEESSGTSAKSHAITVVFLIVDHLTYRVNVLKRRY